jgi:hypothetical protein
MFDDFVGSALSLCICMHWPRYMRDSLILPASARVEPAVFAARARSEPLMVSISAFHCRSEATHQQDQQWSKHCWTSWM